MGVLKSKININSSKAKKNREAMLALIKKLDKNTEKSLFQGKEHHIARARKRGKLLARERIELVLDEDSPFLELLPLAGLEAKGFGAGGTSVSGLSLIHI